MSLEEHSPTWAGLGGQDASAFAGPPTAGAFAGTRGDAVPLPDRSPVECDITQGAPIFRPIQYLGSKLRVVDAITTLAIDVVPSGGTIADLFSGTSVVSQGFARAGLGTTAVDAQLYSALLAKALLGVGRYDGERVSPDIVPEAADGLSPRWAALRSREDELLAAGDAAGLRTLSDSLPLAWRAGKDSADRDAPLTSFYAGGYFGVRQALDLDAIRAVLRRRGTAFTPWARAAATTALLHAASTVVHSAGKHFAQPLKRREANAAFHDGRLLSDRSMDVNAAFRAACERIDLCAPFADSGHAAVCAEVECWVPEGPRKDAYYLDPPYTAQQYSRFYHVLETIATGALPSLPPGGTPSSGLYPDGRYKSAFSSRSRAPAALARLLRDIAGLGAAAIVSYSVSERGSNGNARMVTLDELTSACADAFGTRRVEILPLDHRYRQFNSAGKANGMRDDREVMVLCRPG